jgi:hypothetical protein
MKKLMVLLLAFMMIITITACGDKSGGNQSDQGSNSNEASSTPASKTETEEIKVYGIGEVAETEDLAITIDKVEAAGSDVMLNKAKDGFAYMKVYYTFKNISKETITSPKRKALYIVYEEGATGDDSDMTSDNSSEVMLEVEDRDDRYMSTVDLAPGESTSGWLIYQRQADKQDVTMHYYSKFVNVPPDIVFKFMAP